MRNGKRINVVKINCTSIKQCLTNLQNRYEAKKVSFDYSDVSILFSPFLPLSNIAVNENPWNLHFGESTPDFSECVCVNGRIYELYTSPRLFTQPNSNSILTMVVNVHNWPEQGRCSNIVKTRPSASILQEVDIVQFCVDLALIYLIITVQLNYWTYVTVIFVK